MTELLILARRIHEINVAKGFYDGVDTNDAAQMARFVLLAICEDAEMVEEMRYPEPRMSEKIPFSAEVEEWADSMIRRLDIAVARGFISAGLAAIETKVAYNTTRPNKHSKLF
jgi:hypothetical protein